MDESYIGEPPAIPAPEAPPSRESNMVSDSWQQTVQAVLGVVLLLGAFAMVHYYSPKATLAEPSSDLQKQIHVLTAQIEQLRRSGHARGGAEPLSQFHRLHFTAYIKWDSRIIARKSAPAFPAQDFWSVTASWPPTAT